MKLNVSRKFYVNMRTLDASNLYKRVTRQLPRSQPCLFLYEVVMSEASYQADQRSLISTFSHTNIEGVYEENVPLLWRALLQLGANSTIKPKVEYKHLDKRILD